MKAEELSTGEILSQASNETLLELFKELIEIGKNEAPANVEQSEMLRNLFRAESEPYKFWIGIYSDVIRGIKDEILTRFVQGEIS